MSDDPRHSLGRRGEALAAEHLERLGYRVVARNYRTRFGELDLVVTDDEVLVFCEVKTRRGGSFGPGFEAVDARKRRKLRALAETFLRHHAFGPVAVRFDVSSVRLRADGSAVVEVFEDAF